MSILVSLLASLCLGFTTVPVWWMYTFNVPTKDEMDVFWLLGFWWWSEYRFYIGNILGYQKCMIICWKLWLTYQGLVFKKLKSIGHIWKWKQKDSDFVCGFTSKFWFHLQQHPVFGAFSMDSIMHFVLNCYGILAFINEFETLRKASFCGNWYA